MNRRDDWVQRGINGEGPWWMFFVVFFGLWVVWGLFVWLNITYLHL